MITILCITNDVPKNKSYKYQLVIQVTRRSKNERWAIREQGFCSRLGSGRYGSQTAVIRRGPRPPPPKTGFLKRGLTGGEEAAHPGGRPGASPPLPFSGLSPSPPPYRQGGGTGCRSAWRETGCHPPHFFCLTRTHPGAPRTTLLYLRREGTASVTGVSWTPALFTSVERAAPEGRVSSFRVFPC